MYTELVKDVIRQMKETHGHVIAIDGRCGSGKSTFAKELCEALQADLIQMDDFFLQKAQRTAERYATPGENVDHERVAQVLTEWKKKAPFSYRKFDCTTMSLGTEVQLPVVHEYLVVEGTYSFHRDLLPFYDYTVFFTISAEKQKHRILKRNGEQGLKMFLEKWIPLEELYFTQKDPAKYADVIYDSDEQRIRSK